MKLADEVGVRLDMSALAKVMLFFAATYALSWTCQTPAILTMRDGLQPGSIAMLLLAVGSAGPTLAGVALSAWRGRAAAVRALLLPRHALRARLCLFALLYPVGLHLLGSAMLGLTGQYDAAHVVYPPLRPEQVAIAIVAPLGEEYGWRGYALPRLQQVLSPAVASFVIGLAWALWHIPTLFVPDVRGTSGLELLLYLLAYLSSSVIYTWLYNEGRGSMRGPMLAHLGIHLDNVFRASAMGDGIKPLLSTTIMTTLLASSLVLAGRLQRRSAVSHVEAG